MQFKNLVGLASRRELALMREDGRRFNILCKYLAAIRLSRAIEKHQKAGCVPRASSAGLEKIFLCMSPHHS